MKQRKNALPQNYLEGQCVIVDDIGLENSAETRGKGSAREKLTPNPTPSKFEQRLLDLYRQLPANEQHRLLEQLEAFVDSTTH